MSYRLTINRQHWQFGQYRQTIVRNCDSKWKAYFFRAVYKFMPADITETKIEVVAACGGELQWRNAK